MKRFWGTVHRCILPVLVIVLLTATLAKLETKIFQSEYFFVQGGISSKRIFRSDCFFLFLLSSLLLIVYQTNKILYKQHRAS